jgi:hypothetical protein
MVPGTASYFRGFIKIARPHQPVCYAARVPAAGPLPNPESPRHGAVVCITHWITTIAFFALLLSGAEIVISHPRFYWGETGNVGMRPLFRRATATCCLTRMVGAARSTFRPHGP